MAHLFRFAVCLSLLCACNANSQISNALPQPGSAAPQLHFDHVLQGPPAAQLTWPSLRGKVVVLEFWATWCAPCIGEIPVLNKLQADVDPQKVQILSVDDEDPAIVQSFLKKHTMAGWVALDTSGKLLSTYGVTARPATIVIDGSGKVISTDVPPDKLQASQLMKLAAGKSGTLVGKVDPQVQATLQAATAQAFQQQGLVSQLPSGGSGVSITVAESPADSSEPDTHIMEQSPSDIDITNASPMTLLVYGGGIPRTRIDTTGTLPKTIYNLHVHLKGADAHDRMEAILVAWKSATGLQIQRTTRAMPSLVLKSTPQAESLLEKASHGGMAYYDSKASVLHCINASMSELSAAIEAALKTPVIDETGLAGSLSLTLPTANDLSVVKAALNDKAGLTLTEEQRPIERFTITSPATGSSK